MTALFVIIGVLLVAGLAAALVIGNLIHICPPNSVLIFSGTRRRVGGRTIGYRLVQGGRGIRIPMIEKVDKLDLTNMIIDIRVNGAYSKGGIPLNVEGVANLKIASTEPIIGNAIERFLGKPREYIVRVARETLEGNMRGVLATLTPEEVNQDRVKFAGNLLHEADADLKRIGLTLDTLKIQNVSDDVRYLDSIGRKQGADLLMRSRVAEAENKALVAVRTADNWQTQETAKIDATISEERADAERRIIDAQTRKAAMIAEERSTVTAAIAKATAELDVQNARIEQVRLQLVADEVKPAEAKKAQSIEAARGAAARIIEEGKANASALRQIAHTWNQAGDSARQIFVAQKLSALVGHMMNTVKPLPIDKVTFIDKSLTAGNNNLAVKAAVTSEQLKHTLGIDVPALLERFAAPSNGTADRDVEWVDSSALIEEPTH
jgi:flotillin